MSRVENNTNKPEIIKQIFKSKITFICIMMIITALGIYVVDYRANIMLGNEKRNNMLNIIKVFNWK